MSEILRLDLDEIYIDALPENAAKIKARPPDEDLPGSLIRLIFFDSRVLQS